MTEMKYFQYECRNIKTLVQLFDQSIIETVIGIIDVFITITYISNVFSCLFFYIPILQYNIEL